MRHVFSALILLWPVTVNAGQAEMIQQYCDMVAETAEIVMTNRQANQSLGDMMERINASGASEEGKELNRSIILRAYEYPLSENRQVAIQDFMNSEELACYKRLK